MKERLSEIARYFHLKCFHPPKHSVNVILEKKDFAMMDSYRLEQSIAIDDSAVEIENGRIGREKLAVVVDLLHRLLYGIISSSRSLSLIQER